MLIFEISDVEKATLQQWTEEHESKTGHITKYVGAIGGNLTYCFTPTSIGAAIVVKCVLCSEEKNITDYSSW